MTRRFDFFERLVCVSHRDESTGSTTLFSCHRFDQCFWTVANQAQTMKNLSARRTLFDVQSVTETLTASAIMQLYEQGSIRLDDPVIKHLPYFRLTDERHKDFAVEMLFSHASGVPAMYTAFVGEENSENDAGALRRHIESLEHHPMPPAPGTGYHYSINSYDIVAALTS
jgi:CubicO group peptidase (beta-lactamase class C family)